MTDSHPTSDRRHPTLLQAVGLHKHYHLGGHDLHVLRGVDLEVKRGRWLAIKGASGSGKSTLLHLLGGLDKPDRGTVRFDERDVFAQSSGAVDRYRNASVGFVFQFFHLLPELSALENVLVGAMVGSSVWSWGRRRSKAKPRAAALLEQLGLKERMRHRPSKLSGGERQRVAIARALINEPALLLADEPTGNLDAATGGQILDLFRSLHARGQTIVMVTHDDRIALAADESRVLDAGRLVSSNAAVRSN